MNFPYFIQLFRYYGNEAEKKELGKLFFLCSRPLNVWLNEKVSVQIKISLKLAWVQIFDGCWATEIEFFSSKAEKLMSFKGNFSD